MHIIDTALAKRAANGNPIRVGVYYVATWRRF